MMKLTSWLWTMLALIVIGMVMFYFLQRTLVYAPSKITPKRQAFQAEDMRVIQLATHDGLDLHSWYKPADQKKPTVIIFHGNAGHIGTRMPLARYLITQGLGVLLLEYRGYGGNPGKPTEQGLYDDTRAAMKFLRKEHVPLQNTVLYGESLGTGVATHVATEYPNACALILQSPYTTMSDLGRYHYPWIPIEPWDKFDSIGRIHTIHMPLLALHGTNDIVVPYTQGVALFEAANAPKQWVELPGQGHSDLWQPDFLNAITGFINLHCKPGL
ncbi:MAG: alpha/beta fold hydrolase [Legionellaceae bacterium]|nr:alpha/beta fold hydrolase [Legionellaceae bacterium]